MNKVETGAPSHSFKRRQEEEKGRRKKVTMEKSEEHSLINEGFEKVFVKKREELSLFDDVAKIWSPEPYTFWAKIANESESVEVKKNLEIKKMVNDKSKKVLYFN